MNALAPLYAHLPFDPEQQAPTVIQHLCLNTFGVIDVL